MHEGPAAGLALIDTLLGQGALAGYALAHAARAGLLQRLDRTPQALAAYAVAWGLSTRAAERRFLQARMAGLRQLPPCP